MTVREEFALAFALRNYDRAVANVSEGLIVPSDEEIGKLLGKVVMGSVEMADLLILELAKEKV